MNEVVKHADITITIGLNAENVPVSMQWQAPDGAATGAQACKAMLLSLFSRDDLDTLKIDLWTQDMQVVEMDRFFFQTLRALADTYYKATQNAQLAGDMQRFVQYFGEQTEILPPSTPV